MFAKRLKELRSKKGLTQVQLVGVLGVSKGAVSMWEIGKREPNFETLKKLSEILEAPTDYILGLKNAESPLSWSLRGDGKNLKPTLEALMAGYLQTEPDPAVAITVYAYNLIQIGDKQELRQAGFLWVQIANWR